MRNSKLNIGISAALIISVLASTLYGISFALQTSEKNHQDKYGNYVETIDVNEEISMTPRLMTSQVILAPYKTSDTFLSKEIKSEFEFTSVGGSWEEFTPKGTKIDSFIRFKKDGKWSEWLGLDEEVESQKGSTYNKTAFASTDGADEFQYKFLLYGDSVMRPLIKNLKWTVLKTTATAEAVAEKPLLASSDTEVQSAYIAYTLGKKDTTSGVISRGSWGANEEYRYLDVNTTDAQITQISSDYYDKYMDELKYSKTITENESGREYKWSLQYPLKVKKFIIHHTATTKNLSDPKQAIRDIYYYHAVTRGWGDIGYNYIMDQSGNVYEGRYGGEGVIGGHAGPANNGTIGIAVLGNYEENLVPTKVMNALGKFIGKKAKLHKISPTGKSEFRGEYLPNILGHKDVMATACPGKNLYAKLSSIRSVAAKEYSKTTAKIIEKKITVKEETKASIKEKGEAIRVKIGFLGKPEITADKNFNVYSGTVKITALEKNKVAKVYLEDGKYKLEIAGKSYTKTKQIRFVPESGGILTIGNFNHRPAWDQTLNDNQYRGILEVQIVDGELNLINEVPLEDYLKGLAEAANSDPAEKIKAVVVAARSYAKHYMTDEVKFQGKPYNLDDNPNVSQKYLGYGAEKRSGNVVAASTATAGEVVTYEGKLVKTPYFSSSDGKMTKSAKDVWNWDAPYLISVADTYCKNTAFAGHGVGLSGCGAKGMADAGFTYKEILKHYYTGTEVTKLY